jgi:hypothetical protein
MPSAVHTGMFSVFPPPIIGEVTDALQSCRNVFATAPMLAGSRHGSMDVTDMERMTEHRVSASTHASG